MVDRLKAEQNVAHYRTRLEMGAEPETRAVLLKQLLAEEKDLGRTREQLARIDRDIEKLRRTIAQHQKHIKRFKLVGADTERATLTLSTLNDLMALYERHRQWLTAKVADGEAD